MRRIMIPVFLLLAAAAYAQKPAPTVLSTTTAATEIDSRETREAFRQLLDRMPPQVGMVLKLDPTLFNDQQYLTTYPALASFVAQHPEVAHNPDFYLARVSLPRDPDPVSPNRHMWQETMQGIFILAIVGTIILVFTWLVRTLVEQRRWSRLSRIQTEVHSKLLDRFSSNEELLRYIETPAGRRFLESAPIPLEAGPRPVGAPIARILWSIQSGLVVSAAGVGLMLVAGTDKEGAQPLYAIGVVALCVGVGFILSAVVSFILSRRLKLFEAPEGAV